MNGALLDVPRLASRDRLRVVRAALRAVQGSTSPTPTPISLKVGDVGLLYFLNQKQSQLHETLSSLFVAPLNDNNLGALTSLLEFVRFVVGGVIVEAERIDEALIAVRKEVALVAGELRRTDVELQHQRPKLGSHVDQAIAQHFRVKLAVPQRRPRPFLENLNATENEQLGDLPTTMVGLRAQLRYLKDHQSALQGVQRLLHGSGARIPESEAQAIVAELDIVGTFRKAIHKARDAVIGVGGPTQVAAVDSLLEFFQMLVSGMVAATNALLDLESELVKQCAFEQRTKVIASLDVADARNKQLSAEALRLNELRSFQVGDSRRESNATFFGGNAEPLRISSRDHVDLPGSNPSVVHFLSEYCA